MHLPHDMVADEPNTLTTLVRDATRIPPMAKSELRRRINKLVEESYKKGYEDAKKFYQEEDKFN